MQKTNTSSVKTNMQTKEARGTRCPRPRCPKRSSPYEKLAQVLQQNQYIMGKHCLEQSLLGWSDTFFEEGGILLVERCTKDNEHL